MYPKRISSSLKRETYGYAVESVIRMFLVYLRAASTLGRSSEPVNNDRLTTTEAPIVITAFVNELDFIVDNSMFPIAILRFLK